MFRYFIFALLSLILSSCVALPPLSAYDKVRGHYAGSVRTPPYLSYFYPASTFKNKQRVDYQISNLMSDTSAFLKRQVVAIRTIRPYQYAKEINYLAYLQGATVYICEMEVGSTNKRKYFSCNKGATEK